MAVLMGGVGLLVGLTLWRGKYGAGHLLGLDVVVGVGSWALLPLMPRRPVATTLVLDVLALLSPAATPASTVGTLHVAQRRGFATAVGVGAAGIAAHAVLGVWRPVSGLSYLWWLVLVAVTHAALVGWGALQQARHALLRSLRERAERAEAEQGRRVAEARALEHTRIAQGDARRARPPAVAAQRARLAHLEVTSTGRRDAGAAAAAAAIRATTHQALQELRAVVRVLRDDDEPGTAPPQPVAADLPALVAEAARPPPVDCRLGRCRARARASA